LQRVRRLVSRRVKIRGLDEGEMPTVGIGAAAERARRVRRGATDVRAEM
jgi:hypothetical protein